MTTMRSRCSALGDGRLRDVWRWTTLACMGLGVGIGSSVAAQTLSPNDQPHTGEGRPTPNITQAMVAQYLPPFDLKTVSGALNVETRPDGTLLLVAEGGAIFTMGDLRIEADRIVWDRLKERGEATGHVLVQRGDELLRGEGFVFDGANETFEAKETTLVSAPFTVRAKTLTRQNGETVLAEPRIGVGPGQEFGFSADEASLRGTQRMATLHLRNATFSLIGKRLFRVRSITLPLNSRGRGGESSGLNALFALRSSSLSGLGISVGLPFTLARGVYGEARMDVTTRGGIQPVFTARHDFFGPLPQTERPIFALPGDIAPALADASPIRQLVTARPLPPPYDPILDYSDILPEPNTLSHPTRALERNGFIEGNFSYHREFSGGRRGPVFFSRLPEIVTAVRFPLAPPVPAADNEATLQFLKTPRLTVRGEASIGRYREIQAREPERPHVAANRNRLLLGVGIAPCLLGPHFLLTAETSLHVRRYSGSKEYQVMENNISAQYVLAARSALGAAYIRRAAHGESPFLSDQIDARNEAQLRAQYAFPKGHYALAALARYDLDERKAFDYQFAISYRQGVVEPRLAYRTINRQIVFNIAFPGLTER